MTVRQQFDSVRDKHRKPSYGKEEFAQRGDEIYQSQVRSQLEADHHARIGWILIFLTGSFIVTPIAIAGNLPPANDIPEEILRAEIITEARSPIDGKPLSAIEFAELIVRIETQLARDDAAEGVKTSPFKDVLFLLRVRNFLRSVGIPIK
jgi:hypothetical protein